MISRLLMLTLPPILLSLCGCASQRVIADSEVPQTKPPTAALKVPGPDPLLFEKCKTELLSQDQTSGPGLTSSCSALRAWRLSTETSKSGNEIVVSPQAKAP